MRPPPAGSWCGPTHNIKPTHQRLYLWLDASGLSAQLEHGTPRRHTRLCAQAALDAQEGDKVAGTILANGKVRRWKVVGSIRVLTGSKTFESRPSQIRFSQAQGRYGQSPGKRYKPAAR